MKILYVLEAYSIIEPMGVLTLSSITKKMGHESFIASAEEQDIVEEIKKHGIDLVALSFMTTEARTMIEVSSAVKKAFPNMPIIAGGPHPTYYPQIVDRWDIDAVVVGEGDITFPKILDCIEKGEDYSHLPGVHTRFKKNDLRDLVSDLDSVEWADRTLLESVAPFKDIRMKTFFATRGCPYKCTYCFNSAYNEMFKDKGTILRRRSVVDLIGEIESVIKKYPTDFIRFGDDIFVTKHDEWVDEFARQYKERIGLPFYFLIHPNQVSDSLIKVLSDAGCHSVMMGIESGNAEMRTRILERFVTDRMMLKAFETFKKYNVKVFSNTILGLPDTTLEDDLRSVEFTLECNPTYSGFTVFTPFPRTGLYEFSREKGYLPDGLNFEDGFPASMQAGSCLKTITARQKEIHRNILMLVPIANWLPFLRPLIVKHLIYWKPNPVFNVIGFFSRNYLYRKVFPFGSSISGFMKLVRRVISIDKKNYASSERTEAEKMLQMKVRA